MTIDTLSIQCPYCFELVEISIDPDTSGSMVQDCEVCCQPWSLVIVRDRRGEVAVEVDRLE